MWAQSTFSQGPLQYQILLKKLHAECSYSGQKKKKKKLEFQGILDTSWYVKQSPGNLFYLRKTVFKVLKKEGCEEDRFY